MLQELERLGRQIDLSPTGYSYSLAYWAVYLNPDPERSYVDLLTRQQEGQTPKHGRYELVPELRRNAAEPLLIDDTGEYAFGAGERASSRHPLYRQLLERCVRETGDEQAQRVLSYVTSISLEGLDTELRQRSQRILGQETLPPEFFWAKQRLIFIGSDGERVTHRSAVMAWWQRYYTSKQESREGTCSITGDTGPVLTHKLPSFAKGVANTQGSGAGLATFDKAAYQSYGKTGIDNAPIGVEVAERTHKALTALVNRREHTTHIGHQQFVFWGEKGPMGLDPEFWRRPSGQRIEEGGEWIDEGGEAGKNLFASPYRPDRTPDDSDPFYLVSLKGVKGRIAVTDFEQRYIACVRTNVSRFLACQQTAPKWQPSSVWALCKAAFLPDPKPEEMNRIARALVRSVLFGTPLPDEYALRLIRRIIQERDTFRSPVRAQALALFLSVNDMNAPNAQIHPSPNRVAYALGRIAFLMHQAQVVAQNLQREETNVSRALNSLSTTPATVFPRLYANCIANHLEERSANEDKRRRNYLIKIKRSLDGEFASLGEYDPDHDFPSHLSTHQQAQFFLGFGKARAEFFTKSSNQESQQEQQ